MLEFGSDGEIGDGEISSNSEASRVNLEMQSDSTFEAMETGGFDDGDVSIDDISPKKESSLEQRDEQFVDSGNFEFHDESEAIEGAFETDDFSLSKQEINEADQIGFSEDAPESDTDELSPEDMDHDISLKNDAENTLSENASDNILLESALEDTMLAEDRFARKDELLSDHGEEEQYESLQDSVQTLKMESPDASKLDQSKDGSVDFYVLQSKVQEETSSTSETKNLLSDEPQKNLDSENKDADEPDYTQTSLKPSEEALIRELDEKGVFVDHPIPVEGRTTELPESHTKHLPERSGTFSAEKGNSEFTPMREDAQAKMREYGRETVEYRNNEPDFKPFTTHDSPWGKLDCEVEIGHMTTHRLNPSWEYGRRPPESAHNLNMDIGNFAQADNSLLSRIQETHPDATMEDVLKYQDDNHLTWHECSDGKTMQLVPQEIHSACPHSGGVAEMKERMAWGNVELSVENAEGKDTDIQEAIEIDKTEDENLVSQKEERIDNIDELLYDKGEPEKYDDKP